VCPPVEFPQDRKFRIAQGVGRARQRGIALITAVLIVAIVATVSAHLALGAQVWVRQAQNLNDRAQADAVAKAALMWAMLILDEDTKKAPATDNLTEDWARPLPPLPVEGGAIQGRIVDAQGLFNLNNLLRNGNPSPPDIGVFQRLLTNAGLDPNLYGAVIDWLDSNSLPGPAGAEDNEYLALQPPYRAANQLIASVEELRLIRGFDAAAVDKLRPLVTALPKATAININTAPAPVLSALFTNLPLSMAQQLVVARDKTPYKATGDLAAQAGQEPTTKDLAVTSSYFTVVVETQFGRLSRRSQALIVRSGGAAVGRGEKDKAKPVAAGANKTQILWYSHIL